MERMEAMERAQESEHCLTPAEAFSLIGDETRVRILEALWNVDESPIRFSDLYEVVDTINTAQFNYHLGRLTGHFIRKTADGYELRTAGESVVRAIVEESFNAHPSLDAFETGDPCTRCGDVLVANYDEEMLSIVCPTCGLKHGKYSFPPGGLIGRDDEEVLAAFNQRVRHLHCLAKDGVCPECSGPMQTVIVSGGDCCLDVDLRAEHSCEQCRHTLCSTVGLALLDQARVVAFYRDHGVDLGTVPYWRLDWCVSDEYTAIRSTDPWRIEVSIRLDGEALVVTLDENLKVVETSRQEIPGVS